MLNSELSFVEINLPEEDVERPSHQNVLRVTTLDRQGAWMATFI